MEKNRSDIIAKLAADMVPIPGMQYSICKYPVTQELWEEVMGENPSKFKGSDRPVENVSWYDCREFINKVNNFPSAKEASLVFRLPSVDEWVFACRAGATGSCCRLADGSEITSETVCKVAWCSRNGNRVTHPVGKKKPNAFGLHDMLGNVWEWTSTSVGEWKATSLDCEKKYLCGGSWAEKVEVQNSRSRGLKPLNYYHYIVGFRLVCTTIAEREAETRRLAAEKAVELEKLLAGMVSIPGAEYSMCKFPVTQALWTAIMGDNPSYFRGPDKPVEEVSRTDVETFIEKLNASSKVKELGRLFRLPTIAEWQFACRAGARGRYCKLADGTIVSGKTLGDVAWFRSNSGGETHPVGQKKPNAFGLYDMLGNVREWAAYVREDKKIDWFDFGGSWDDYAVNCVAETIDGIEPDINRSGRFYCGCHVANGISGRLPDYDAPRRYLGFRLACDRDLTDEECNAKEKAEKMAPARMAAKSIAANRPAREEVAKLAANMVSIPGKGYAMCKYEVTQALWKAVMGENPSELKGVSRPVDSVSWNDCQLFIESLNALPEVMDGCFIYRLPTTDEWVYSCRAGATGDYCRLADGTEIEKGNLDQVAWCCINANLRTHPVGKLKPNAFGLFDMLGNVCEWTSTAEGRNMIACGGCWNSDENDLANRSIIGSGTPEARYLTFGLRLAADYKALEA